MDPVQMPDIKFENLEQPPNLDQSLMQKLDTAINSQNWIDHHHFITALRSIHKYYPQYIPNVMEKYGNGIYNMLTIGKTQLIKNIYKLLQQIFNVGKQINVSGIVQIFLPYLLKKASTDLGHMKQLAQQVVSSFSQNCGYDVSFLITSTHLCDKNNHIAELAVKLLAKIIQNTGNSIMKLNFDTLKTLMHQLFSTIQGKRANMKTWALDICMYIYNQIGQENYLSLMNHTLTTEQIQSMGKSMQLHRVSKNKHVPLANALKQRKTMMNQVNQQQQNYQGQFGQQYNGYN